MGTEMLSLARELPRNTNSVGSAPLYWFRLTLTAKLQTFSSSISHFLSSKKMPASNSASLFVRGAWPAAIGTATAGISGSKAATLNAQIQAISTAGSMNELIETIPSRYRPLLAPILREMQELHGKFCNTQKNLATL